MFFGCTGQPGHHFHCKSDRRFNYDKTPWGAKLDGGLLTDNYYQADTSVTGKVAVVRKDGWTAMSFWDRSGGDSRAGCSSTFLAHAELGAITLLELAKVQWPEIFSRAGFPELILPISEMDDDTKKIFEVLQRLRRQVDVAMLLLENNQMVKDESSDPSLRIVGDFEIRDLKKT